MIMERNEAIEVVKRNYPHVTENGSQFETALRTLIPELKESEEERIIHWIREELESKYVTDNIVNNVMADKALAWLEKQGKNNMGISEATKQKLEDNLNKALEKETPESLNEFLDKQGEYNLIENYPIFRVGDCIRNKKTNDKVLIEQLDIATKTYWHVSYDGAAVNHSDFPFSQQNEWELIGQNITEKKLTDEEMKILLQTEYEKGKADAIEQKSAWSEDDKRKINRIYSILGQAADTHAFSTTCRLIGDKECVELQDFLKSIKGRVQPKQEWSEEDEYVYNEILKRVADKKLYEHDLEYIYKWLNSLRPQPQWKPSESDILLLERIANGKSNPQDFQASLSGLIEQLKKLKA